MNTYTLRDVRYWLNRETRVWWAARYDSNGNQIGDAVHAATRDGIRKEIDACLTPPRAAANCKLYGVPAVGRGARVTTRGTIKRAVARPPSGK